jgi:hypothetical protein
VTNTLAYLSEASVTRIKFLNANISGLYYKSFIIVTYDHDDSSLYYKTKILANLALARSVNYDHKVCCKLKRT